MKKLCLMFALAAFIGANTVSKSASAADLIKVECEKCGNKDAKCSKEDKKGKSCHGEAKAGHGTDGAASSEGSGKSCGAKKSCCKSKAKAEANAADVKTEETAPSTK